MLKTGFLSHFVTSTERKTAWRWRHFHLLSPFIFLAFFTQSSYSDLLRGYGPQEILRIHTGASPAFENYYHAVLHLALDITSDDYGPYQFSIVDKRNGSDRTVIRAMKDSEWHVMFISRLSEVYKKSPHVGIQERAIFRGLMSLRKFIVSKNNFEAFKGISTIQGLRKIRIGQGEGWRENDIYRAAKVPLVEASKFDTLFPMLINGRFDAIPLSVLEIEATLSRYKRQYPDLAILPQLYVYYPLPTYMITSKTNEKIYDRLSAGVSRILAGDQLDELLNKRFGVNKMGLRDLENRIIYLTNPELTNEENKQYTEKFYSQNIGVSRDKLIKEK